MRPFKYFRWGDAAIASLVPIWLLVLNAICIVRVFDYGLSSYFLVPFIVLSFPGNLIQRLLYEFPDLNKFYIPLLFVTYVVDVFWWVLVIQVIKGWRRRSVRDLR